MPRFSSLLAPFNAITKPLQSPGQSPTSTSFDSLVARVDKFAKIVNSIATQRDQKDTDTSDIVAQSTGDATAAGENTLVAGKMVANAADVGLVSYVVGTTTFTAAATTTDGHMAAASSTTSASVAGGDLVLIRNSTAELPATSGNDTAISTSTTTYIAIDLAFWESPAGALTLETTQQKTLDEGPIALTGNAATLDAKLVAEGAASLVAIDSQVLSIENTLSTVSASAHIGVGD